MRVERLLRKKLTWEDEEEGSEEEETVLNDDMEHSVTVVAPGRRVNHGMIAGQDSSSLIPSRDGIWDAKIPKSRALWDAFSPSLVSYQSSILGGSK